MDVDTRLLRYFAAVAAEGSLSRAAERLFVSQPALTKQIKQLESQLGAQLFTRSRAGMTLTASGQALAGRTPGMLADWDQAVRETRAAASRAAHVLRVGFMSSAANEATQQIIAAFGRRRPGWRGDLPPAPVPGPPRGHGRRPRHAPPRSPTPPADPTPAPASPTGPSPASARARSASPGRPPTTATPSSRTSSAAAWTTSRLPERGRALPSAGADVLGADPRGQPDEDGRGPVRRAGHRGRDHRGGHRAGRGGARAVGGAGREGRLRGRDLGALVPAGARRPALPGAAG